jgi:hypothetical protein
VLPLPLHTEHALLLIQSRRFGGVLLPLLVAHGAQLLFPGHLIQDVF